MSSETSTNRSTFRPWHFFVLGALLVATVAVLRSSNTTPEATILVSLAIGAAAFCGLALLRTLWPLVAVDFEVESNAVSNRTRVAVEREKQLVLRSIKELEFDRAMGKVAEDDFKEMTNRLRARAISFMRQLDSDTPGYSESIEQELQSRLAAHPVSAGTPNQPSKAVGGDCSCEVCATVNDADARFCKYCGASL
mgnify:CR=1 FL=1|tara:strand:- start:105 stop:689 length:585 start_codon:yes stop_codon:yes gene_type:complete